MIKKIMSLFMTFSFVLASNSIAAASDKFEPTARNVEIIVPYPPGGGADTLARTVSSMLVEHGWKSIVTNRPGADTVIGANSVAAAKADGHTLYMGGNGFLDANLVFGAPGIQYTKDSFTSVAPLGMGSLVLLVDSNSPIKDYKTFKEYVKKNPDQFNLGFWNSYTANLFYEWARLEGLPRPKIINYRGSAPLETDIMGGHLKFGFDTVGAARQNLKANKLRAIAVLDQQGKKLLESFLPGATTIVAVEESHPGVALTIYYGLFGPSGMPDSVTQEINRVVNRYLKDPKYSKKWDDFSVISPGGSSDELTDIHTKFYKMFKDAKR